MWVTVVYDAGGDIDHVYGFGYEGEYAVSDPEKAAKAFAYDVRESGVEADAFELEAAG